MENNDEKIDRQCKNYYLESRNIYVHMYGVVLPSNV